MALSFIDNDTTTDRVLIVDEPIYYVSTKLDSLYESFELPKIDNSYRGGSKGKGGKIKYRRS